MTSRSKLIRLAPLLVPLGTLAAVSLSSTEARADVSLPAAGVTIDFTGFDGTGFAPDPAAGQLDSDDWSVLGLDDGDLDFGATGDAGDYARGTSGGGVTTGGVYAFDVDGGDYALGVQPGGDDFAPGSFTLRLVNDSGHMAADLEVAYDLWVNNDEERSNSFNLEVSTDGTTFTPVAALDYDSPEASDADGFQMTARSTTIEDLNVPAGGQIWLRWTSDDVSGAGARDEFAIDDIVVTAIEPCPGMVAWGGFDDSRLTTNTVVLADGSQFTQFRNAISAENGCFLPPTDVLTAEYLADVDVFFTSALDDDDGVLSANEQQALADWITAGGTLVATADIEGVAFNETFTSAYGVTDYTVVNGSGTGTPTGVAHPLTTNVTTLSWGTSTYHTFDAATGVELVTNNDNNEPFVTVLEPTDFCAGGRIVVIGDQNLFTSALFLTTDNATFADNLAAWAAADGGDCCGNGNLDPNEECDDANDDNTDNCLDTCVMASCGDGFVWDGEEECDDANADNTDDCLDTCDMASCGDGFVWDGEEECDDMNADNTDDCIDTCEMAVCGDGYVWDGMEECDDANEDRTDECLNDCTVPMMGTTGTGTGTGGDTDTDGTTGGDDTTSGGETGDGTTGGGEGSTSGPSTNTATVTDSNTASDSDSDTATATLTGGMETDGDTDTDTGGLVDGDDGCGCTTRGSGPTGPLWSLLGLLGLAIGRRRKEG